jgi:hypothetical protein
VRAPSTADRSLRLRLIYMTEGASRRGAEPLPMRRGDIPSRDIHALWARPPRLALAEAGTWARVKLVRFLASAPLLVVGVVLALYGVLALTFNERGGSTYVTLSGHRLDAHRVGAVCLVLGLAVIAAAIALVRRGRVRS